MTDESKDKLGPPAFSCFRQSVVNPSEFTITFELVPSRGGRSRQLDRTLGLARSLAADGRIQAVSITDNAGGHPALSPDALGLEILDLGLDVISHFSCKDKNRNEIESQLFGWDRAGLQNLLVISGDYPQQGYRGHAKPVFDLDSVQVTDMLNLMNQGRYLNQTAPATSFFKGVAVSPFKLTCAEQLMQYYKLHRKIAAGADYVITQLGFDARKFHEVLLYMRQHQLRVPLLGSVFIPSLPLVEIMHRGGVPGCIIPERLYAEMKKEAGSPDQGRRARLIRAAKLMAVLKEMGYDGAHIGGPGLRMEDFDFMLAAMDQYQFRGAEIIQELNFWPEDGFYLYRKDRKTGLNLEEGKKTGQGDHKIHAGYRLTRMIHDAAFDPESSLFQFFRWGCLALHRSALARPFATLEHLIKFLLFACQNCGDCTLASLAYLCPQSGCAKYMLNGPCGGSRDGWCEVYPGKKRCIYVKAFERLSATGDEQGFAQGFVPPRNWRLTNSSSWLNFYQGSDNQGEKRKG